MINCEHMIVQCANGATFTFQGMGLGARTYGKIERYDKLILI